MVPPSIYDMNLQRIAPPGGDRPEANSEIRVLFFFRIELETIWSFASFIHLLVSS